MPDFAYHTFLPYAQADAIDQCGVLQSQLALHGVKTWWDQVLQGALTEDAMRDGVTHARTYLLFLSKTVFARPFVLMELRRALELQHAIIFVHETDERNQGYERLEVLISKAPEEVRPLFRRVESVPYRRRLHEREAMVAELARRMGGA